MATTRQSSRRGRRVPIGNAHPRGRRFSRRRVRTAIAWTMIVLGLAILAGLAVASF